MLDIDLKLSPFPALLLLLAAAGMLGSCLRAKLRAGGSDLSGAGEVQKNGDVKKTGEVQKVLTSFTDVRAVANRDDRSLTLPLQPPPPAFTKTQFISLLAPIHGQVPGAGL